MEANKRLLDELLDEITPEIQQKHSEKLIAMLPQNEQGQLFNEFVKNLEVKYETVTGE